MTPFRLRSHVKRRRHGVHQHTPAISYNYLQLCKAYNLPKVGAIQLPPLGIISLGGEVSLPNLKTYFDAHEAPTPIVTILGLPGAGPTKDAGANIEDMLDVTYGAAPGIYATGLSQEIAVCFGDNSSGTAIADCALVLAKYGCKKISCSWGLSILSWLTREIQYTEEVLAYLASIGVSFVGSSGDDSAFDGAGRLSDDYPSCSVYSWSAGATSLRLYPDGSIAQESAWGDGKPQDPGTGGGFAPFVRPAWQKAALAGYPNNQRGCPDFALVGDPDTGVDLYANDQWYSGIGGTSLVAPFAAGYLTVVAGVLAQQKKQSLGNPGPVVYPHPEAFHDITVGSNGRPTAKGWDPVTGLGSFDGQKLMDVILTAQPLIATVPANGHTTQPPAPVTPAPVTPPAPVVTLNTIEEAIDAAFARWRALNAPWVTTFLNLVEKDVLAALETALTATPAIQPHGVLAVTGAGAMAFLEKVLPLLGPAAVAFADAYIEGLNLPSEEKAALEEAVKAILQPKAQSAPREKGMRASPLTSPYVGFEIVLVG